ELLIPQVREIVQNYDVEGIFFDTMADLTPCHCPHCRKLFKKEIPLSKENSLWPEYTKWFSEQYKNFFIKVLSLVHNANPEVKIGFNWMWCERDAEVPPEDIDWLVLDTAQGNWQSLMCSFSSKYFAGTDYPFDVMVGRFLHGLGDWSTRPSDMLKQEVATTTANAGGFFIIDRMLPDGSLDKEAYQALKNSYSIVKEREDVVKDIRHIAEIGILHSANSLIGKNLEFYADFETRNERLKPIKGAFKLLMEHGRHFTILNEEMLNKKINEYKLIILPEQEFLEDKTKANLVKYVKNGGKVLASQIHSKTDIDKNILKLFGTEFKEFTKLEYGYIGAKNPIMIRGSFAKTKTTTGVEVSPYLIPSGAEERKGDFGWGVAPPDKKADFPAVIFNKFGKGESIYITAPIFLSYLDFQNPHLARYILGLVDKLFPDPTVKLFAPPQVELVVARKNNGLIIHLVNHSGERMIGKWPLTEYVPEFSDIKVFVRADREIKTIVSIPSNKRIPFTINGLYAEFLLQKLHVMESIKIADYF
ncbi:MAG: beta-galactosidase trimerization domain-containing protein, partial [Candidatus Omnitrophica bacterium]|nr:beta-galactosidase trimerization domain-containing protein [Candidatus Omnitrophota bacterium]